MITSDENTTAAAPEIDPAALPFSPENALGSIVSGKGIEAAALTGPTAAPPAPPPPGAEGVPPAPLVVAGPWRWIGPALVAGPIPGTSFFFVLWPDLADLDVKIYLTDPGLDDGDETTAPPALNENDAADLPDFDPDNAKPPEIFADDDTPPPPPAISANGDLIDENGQVISPVADNVAGAAAAIPEPVAEPVKDETATPPAPPAVEPVDQAPAVEPVEVAEAPPAVEPVKVAEAPPAVEPVKNAPEVPQEAPPPPPAINCPECGQPLKSDDKGGLVCVDCGRRFTLSL